MLFIRCVFAGLRVTPTPARMTRKAVESRSGRSRTLDVIDQTSGRRHQLQTDVGQMARAAVIPVICTSLSLVIGRIVACCSQHDKQGPCAVASSARTGTLNDRGRHVLLERSQNINTPIDDPPDTNFTMSPPAQPYQPYAALHTDAAMKGPGDTRPTALQVVKDLDATGAFTGKTAVITGCSTGLGVETARALYEAGMALFLTARDMKRLGWRDRRHRHQQHSLPAWPELVSNSSTAEGDRDSSRFSRQRAQGGCRDPFAHGFETHIGTNHMSHFLLFQLLKPALLSAGTADCPSRVINLSSAGHIRSGIHFDDISWTAKPSEYERWTGYGQSKTANIYMANSITRHYSCRHLIGLSVHPGGIFTELGKHMTDDDRKRIDLAKMTPRMKNVEQGAATTVWATLTPHFNSVANGGRYLCDVGESGPLKDRFPAGPGYAAHAYDEQSEERLWEISCAAVGVSSQE
nr:putative oxidoreductase [Quercus suber]